MNNKQIKESCDKYVDKWMSTYEGTGRYQQEWKGHLLYPHKHVNINYELLNGIKEVLKFLGNEREFVLGSNNAEKLSNDIFEILKKHGYSRKMGKSISCLSGYFRSDIFRDIDRFGFMEYYNNEKLILTKYGKKFINCSDNEFLEICKVMILNRTWLDTLYSIKPNRFILNILIKRDTHNMTLDEYSYIVSHTKNENILDDILNYLLNTDKEDFLIYKNKLNTIIEPRQYKQLIIQHERNLKNLTILGCVEYDHKKGLLKLTDIDEAKRLINITNSEFVKMESGNENKNKDVKEQYTNITDSKIKEIKKDERCGILKVYSIKEFFGHEKTDLVPVLFNDDNNKQISNIIGVDELTIFSMGTHVGRFISDVLCTDEIMRKILFEVQKGRGNHDHFGKIMTYGGGLKPDISVWIAEEFDQTQLDSLRELNETTNNRKYFAIKMCLIGIDNSKPAIMLTCVLSPSKIKHEN